MVLVAVVGLALAGGPWAVEMHRLRRQHLQQAARHSVLASLYSAEVARLQGNPAKAPNPLVREWLEAALEWNRRALLISEQARDKHQRAACYPWLPVEPDPPDPMTYW
jgi:hypothetical protein